MIRVAIDGPAGAGKSTISKAVAEKLGFVYIDTGAMYRACALYAIENGIEIEENAVVPNLDKINIDIKYTTGGQVIYLNGENVSERIRQNDVSMGASAIAVIPAVRLKLVELQRKLAGKQSVIMDGRDIGTYVLPDAEMKIYLTASVEERAKRRCVQLMEKGEIFDIESIKKDIQQRDSNDMNRDFAPLRKADDAVLLDSSELTREETVDTVVMLIEKKSEELKRE